jgi:hypothetical protein
MKEIWPWLLLAGLGAFHGLNPAMGWLFAVALGVHRQSGRVVVRAVPAIAVGHALSIAMIAGIVVATGFLVDGQVVRTAVAAALVGWALWHQIFGHRRRVRIGMQTGLAGLALWSFLMATAHGAGLMVLPAIMPLCLTGSPINEIGGSQTAAVTLAALGVHTLAMLTATGVIAFAVYRWIGLDILRSAWINVDIVWTLVLLGTGILLLLA